MAKQWVAGQAFPAVVGRDYEVAFGNITYQEQAGMWTARIHVAAPGAANWIDLETGKVLDPQLSKFVVQAYVEIQG